MACALGLGEQMVGRSHECDFPEWVKSLPVCTEPKFDVGGSSADASTANTDVHTATRLIMATTQKST